MKRVIGLHRKYGVLEDDAIKEGKRYITVDDGFNTEVVQTGGYLELTEQDVISRLKFEVNLIVSKAKFFGLTEDQVQSLFVRPVYSEEVKRLALEYRQVRSDVSMEEFANMTPKERTAQVVVHQTPLLDLIGDTWANRFNFEGIVEDILSESKRIFNIEM